MSMSLAEIRLQVLSLSHKQGESPENVLSRADIYLKWVLRGEDKGSNLPSNPGEPGATSGDKLDSALGNPRQATKPNQSHKNYRR